MGEKPPFFPGVERKRPSSTKDLIIFLRYEGETLRRLASAIDDMVRFSLNKDLHDISFYDVFLAIEGRGRIFQSQGLLQNFIGSESGKAKRCAITNALDEIENTLVRTLSNVSLAQVADETQYNYNLGYLDEWIDEMD